MRGAIRIQFRIVTDKPSAADSGYSPTSLLSLSPNSPDDKITTAGGRYDGRPTARLITFLS